MQRFRLLGTALFVALFVALLAALLAALAMATAGPAAAQQRTTATYGDWILACITAPGPPAKKHCDIVQVTQLKGRHLPFSRIVVEQPVKGKPIELLVLVPVDVSLAGKVRIQTSASDPGVAAPFKECVPAGCIAAFALDGAVLRKFRSAAKGAKVTFKLANGRDAAIPLSFKGFDQALDALSRQ